MTVIDAPMMTPTYPPTERPIVADHIDLAAVRTAVSCARLLTKYALTNWGARSIVDDACLIVSELVTNAVRATGITDESPKWSDLSKLNVLNVRLEGLSDCIVIKVWDASTELPTLKDAADIDEGGRGLSIVDAMCSDWGSYPHRGGKVVWATLPVYTHTSHGLLKRTRKHPQSPASVVPPVHPDLLRRVRDGLKSL